MTDCAPHLRADRRRGQDNAASRLLGAPTALICVPRGLLITALITAPGHTFAAKAPEF